MEFAWVVPMGLLIGLAVGALGGGGSILAVPILVYLLGQTPAAATTGSLIIVGLTSLIGVIPHFRQGNVQLRRGLLFGVLGAVGSYAGSRLASGVPSAVLLTAFAGLMLVVAFLMWRRAIAASTASQLAGVEIRPLRVVVAATGVGLLTGFFGVGGGFAVVPALVLVLGLPMPVAVGTSLVVMVVNSASAFASRLGNGVVLDWPMILGFAVFAVIGSLLGARLTKQVSARHLSFAFISMLVAIAGYMAAMNVPALFS